MLAVSPKIRTQVVARLRDNMREAMTGENSYTTARLGHVAGNLVREMTTREQWGAAERAGLVKFEAVPDDDRDWADLAGDCYDVALNAPFVPGGARTIKAQEKAERARAEREGVYGIVGRYRTSEDDKWHTGDSVWGFIGDDWRDSDCDVDVMAATLDALRKALASRCPRCRK